MFPDGRSGLQRIETGRFRSFPGPMQIVSGPVGYERVHYQAPASAAVPAEMTAFLDWFNHAGQGDALLHAALAHLWFEAIHPFEDGNGRIGRAIVDMALARQLGSNVWLYGLSRHLSEHRSSYYEALSRAQGPSMDATPWLQWFVEQFELACRTSAAGIDSAVAKAQFWAEHGQKPLNARQFKVVRKLLDAGDGGFLGGMTADKYAKITGVSKATATRDLGELARQGLLRVSGAGKATRYDVCVRGWQPTK